MFVRVLRDCMNEEKILIESNQPDVRLFDSFLSLFSPKFKMNVVFKVVFMCLLFLLFLWHDVSSTLVSLFKIKLVRNQMWLLSVIVFTAEFVQFCTDKLIVFFIFDRF